MSDESNPILTGAPEAAPAPAAPASQPAEIGLTPQAQPTDDIIDYSIGGKSYKVSKGFIDTLTSMSQQQAQAEKPVQAPVVAPEDNLDELWYTNPRRAAEMVRQQAVQEVQTIYRQEQFWNGFWKDFGTENPDLVQARPFAEMLLQSQFNEFAPLAPEVGRKLLADRTRQQLTSYTATLRSNVPAPLPVLSEGASQATRDVTNFTDAAGGRGKVESLSEAIRARRESRRATNTKPASTE